MPITPDDFFRHLAEQTPKFDSEFLKGYELVGSQGKWAESYGEMLFQDYCKTLNIVRTISEGLAFEPFELCYERSEWEDAGEQVWCLGYPDLTSGWKTCPNNNDAVLEQVAKKFPGGVF